MDWKGAKSGGVSGRGCLAQKAGVTSQKRQKKINPLG